MRKIQPSQAHNAAFESSMAAAYIQDGALDKAAPHVERTIRSMGYRPGSAAPINGMPALAAATEASKLISSTYGAIQKLGSGVTIAPSEDRRLEGLLATAYQACRQAETPQAVF